MRPRPAGQRNPGRLGCAAHGSAFDLDQKRKFPEKRYPDGQINSSYQKSRQVLSRKIFVFRFTEKYDCIRPSRLHRRGVSRSSRTLEAGCGGREDAQRACAPTKASFRTAKPCGPVPPTLGSSFSQDVREKRRWLTSPEHRGERGAAVNTIAQGMPAVPAEPVVPAACVFCCRRAMGAASIRHSLRPPDFEGHD